MKSKHSMTIFFVIVFLHYISANLAHPITPTLIVNLKLPSYMFGAAFAAMSFTGFLFSPFWGKMREYFSAKVLLLVGSIGYGIGQYLFSIATTEITILSARCISGFFVGAIGVSTLIYLSEMSKPQEVGINLAKLTIFQALGGAVGFLIGGGIGVYSIQWTFLFQAFFIIFCGILFYFFLEDNSVADLQDLNIRLFLREINPVQSFLSAKSFLNLNFALLFLVLALVNIGNSAFDQSFNYYIKDQLQFSSLYNGILKAITGLITLAVNSTVCLWIIRSQKIVKASILAYLGCAISAFILFATSHVIFFFFLSILFFGFYSISIPLLQDSIQEGARVHTRNMVMGFYNSIRSLGMILGALLAGFVYDFQPTLPFILSGICFTIAVIILFFKSRVNA